MARKEVDLVIRARDQAAKVVEQITDAVNAFNTAQGKMTTGASKTETAMTGLGAAFTKLDGAIKGVQAAEKVARDFGRAEASVKSLRSSLDQVEAQARDTGRSLGQMDARVESLTGKVHGSTQALSQQKATLKEAAAAQGSLAGQITNTQAKLTRLTGDIAKSNAATEQKVTKLEEAKARYGQLEAEIAAVEKPTKRLTLQFEAAGRAMERAAAVVDKTRARSAALEAELQKTSVDLERLKGNYDQATASTSRYERMVAKTQTSLAKHSSDLRAARGAQKALADANRVAVDSASRLTSAYDRASTEMVEMKNRAEQAASAVLKLASASSTATKGDARGVMLGATRAMAEARAASQRAEADAAAATRSDKGRVFGTQSEAFEKAKAASAAARQEFLLHQVAVEEMRRAYAQMDGTVEGTRAGLLRIQQAQRNLTANLQAFRAAQAQVKTATDQTTAATQRQARAANELKAAQNPAQVTAFAAAMRALGHEKRTALSWTQRLRGEVISLVAAYAGLYGAINVLGQVVKATQTVEAAQSRLNVAMDGTGRSAAQEMDYVRRTADRLGIEFGVLAQEYSKFSIATKGTTLQGQKTRDIFEAVAEAARVNKNSTEEMAGVFVALTQIVSKGAVQMEELRQQLGDRLPGAIQIMADGLGVGTDELIAMMEQGQVSANALVGFAEELRRRFGPGLADSLTTTSAELGRFKNAAFQALVAFGEAGFIESFNNLLRDMIEVMKSPEFKTFTERLSAGIAVVIDGLAWLVRNFQLVAAAATALIGVKVYSTFLTVRAALATTGTAAAGAAVQMGVLSRATVGAARSMKALMATSVPGLVLTAAASLVGFWLTSATDVNEALTEHTRIMDEVRNAYEKTGGSLEKWREALSSVVTVTDAKTNIDNLKDAIAGLDQELEAALTLRGGGDFNSLLGVVVPGYGRMTRASAQYREETRALIESWRAGGLSAADLRTQVDALNQKYDDGSESNKRFARDVMALINQIVPLEANLGEAGQTLTALTGETEEATDALVDLAGATEDAGAAAREAEENAKKYAAAMNEIKSAIPAVKKELEYLEASEALQNHLEAAIKAAATWWDIAAAIAAAGEAQNGLRDEFFGGLSGGRVSGSLFDWFKREEGLRTEAYQDQGGVWTIGLGHTSAAGGLQVGPGTKITEAEAVKLFDQDIAKFAARVDAAVKVPITDAMRTALISYDYNTGKIVGSEIVRLLNEGDYAGAQKALAGGIATIRGKPSDALRQRRLREAELFGSQGLTSAEIEAAQGERDVKAREEAVELAEKERKAKADFHATQNESLETAEFELSVQNKSLVARETALALREAELAAEKAGTHLTEEQRQKIIQTTEAKYRQKQIDEEAAAVKEKATKAEERVNALTQQRAELLEQMQMAADAGDVEKAEALRSQIAEINAELIQAIELAQQMWKAVGGDAAEAAIARLETAKLTAQKFNVEAKQSLIDWKRVGTLFVDGLSNAFGDFAKAVAEGASVGEAARNAFLKFASDFLIQIGQMIVKQAILNALRGTSLGGLFGIPAVGVPVAHTGTIVGSGGGSRRSVSPALFAGAARYHQGGFPGLGPEEIPIIAERGEQILSKDDPANALNGGGATSPGSSAPSPRPVKIVNRLSSREVASAVFDDDDGSEVIENYFRVNASKISAILSGG